MSKIKFNHRFSILTKPFFYKVCMVLCITGILSIFLFACNSSKEASSQADSAAVAMPSVDSTSVVPVDTSKTKPDSTQMPDTTHL